MLTDKELKAAKPREKPYKLSDGLGLYVEVKPNGSKLWRLKCRYVGRLAAIVAGMIGVFIQVPPSACWLRRMMLGEISLRQTCTFYIRP